MTTNNKSEITAARKSGNVSRRKLLRTGGALTAGGLLAGCTGGDGGGDGGADTPTDTDGGGGDTPVDGDETTTTSQSGFPEKEITFIVPYGPGGGYDFYTRTLATVMNEKDIVPVKVSVKNVEGAGGVTATNQVWNAEPNGYTNMIVNTEAFAISQIARPNAAKYKL